MMPVVAPEIEAAACRTAIARWGKYRGWYRTTDGEPSYREEGILAELQLSCSSARVGVRNECLGINCPRPASPDVHQ